MTRDIAVGLDFIEIAGLRSSMTENVSNAVLYILKGSNFPPVIELIFSRTKFYTPHLLRSVVPVNFPDLKPK